MAVSSNKMVMVASEFALGDTFLFFFSCKVSGIDPTPLDFFPGRGTSSIWGVHANEPGKLAKPERRKCARKSPKGLWPGLVARSRVGRITPDIVFYEQIGPLKVLVCVFFFFVFLVKKVIENLNPALVLTHLIHWPFVVYIDPIVTA